MMAQSHCIAQRLVGSDTSVNIDSLRRDAFGFREPQTQEMAGSVKYTPDNILIFKSLLYDQHTLADVYPYRDTTREFQWEKIAEGLALLENAQSIPSSWAVLQNRQNVNGEAPLSNGAKRNTYGRMADRYGTERWQGIPLYTSDDMSIPQRYALDGTLIRVLDRTDSTGHFKAQTIYFEGEWLIPEKYVKQLADTMTVFTKTIFVDRTNQNIATIERSGPKWLVRSMNPATTGLHKPPYQQETPLGIFVVQQKKPKMIYLVDGTTRTGGFAPWASRFCNGGYIHGVPVNTPSTQPIEFSSTLGTTPRSHMCVRNATSHAKFVYDWAPIGGALVFVFD